MDNLELRRQPDPLDDSDNHSEPSDDDDDANEEHAGLTKRERKYLRKQK